MRPLLSAEGTGRAAAEVRARSRDHVAGGPPGRDADQAVVFLYHTHYRPLTRLAALLASDEATAEEIVRDAFVAMHGAWRHLRDSDDQALSYLQEAVVRRSRSRRGGKPASPNGPPNGSRPDPPNGSRPDPPDHTGQTTHESEPAARPAPSLVAALRSLPAPQREALVLRYYADWPETRIALVMGISARAVNGHLAYGMSCLQAVLGPD